MSTYATEFEYTDPAGVEFEVARCLAISRPLRFSIIDIGRAVDVDATMYRADVHRLIAYLNEIANTVPRAPAPAPPPDPPPYTGGATPDADRPGWSGLDNL
jgi:hypothetical protein